MTTARPEDRPKAQQTPGILALLALLGLPIGLYVSTLSSRDWVWQAAAVAPLSLGLLAFGWARSRSAAPDGSDVAVTDRKPLTQERILGEGVLSRIALFIGLGVAAVGSYFGLFWLIAAVGLSMTAAYWKCRPYHGLRGALPMVGIFLAAYGIIGASGSAPLRIPPAAGSQGARAAGDC